MNIFYLDHDPQIASKYHCNKHVVKMILETAQMLSTCHHVYGTDVDGLYKPTHKNHPSSVWVRESKAHYDWTFSLFKNLSKEFKSWRGKDHMSWTKLANKLSNAPTNISSDIWLDTPPLCMPDIYKSNDPVTSYRNYYQGDKAYMATWTDRIQPDWWEEKE